MFRMGGVGPMFGQLGFFNKFAGKAWEDKRPLGRYVDESKRLLGVMDAALAGKTWFLGDAYTIADISMLGRSEEHTSELQSLMRSSYAVFCLKKKNYNHTHGDRL